MTLKDLDLPEITLVETLVIPFVILCHVLFLRVVDFTIQMKLKDFVLPDILLVETLVMLFSIIIHFFICCGVTLINLITLLS